MTENKTELLREIGEITWALEFIYSMNGIEEKLISTHNKDFIVIKKAASKYLNYLIDNNTRATVTPSDCDKYGCLHQGRNSCVRCDKPYSINDTPSDKAALEEKMRVLPKEPTKEAIDRMVYEFNRKWWSSGKGSVQINHVQAEQIYHSLIWLSSAALQQPDDGELVKAFERAIRGCEEWLNLEFGKIGQPHDSMRQVVEDEIIQPLKYTLAKHKEKVQG